MGPDSVKMMCQGNIFYIYTSTSRAPVTIFYVPNTPGMSLSMRFTIILMGFSIQMGFFNQPPSPNTNLLQNKP
jgi:hypothetical protein